MDVIDEKNDNGTDGEDADRIQSAATWNALFESEKRFSTFMRELPVNVMIKDENSTVLFVNRHMDENFDASAWVGKTAADNLPPQIAERVMADDKKVLEGGRTKVIEERIPIKTGEMRMFETYKFPIPRAGKPPLLGLISLDITERKKGEETLQTSERFLRSTLDGLSANIALVDEHGEIMLVNRAWKDFARVNGASPASVSEGGNYFDVCREATGCDSEEAMKFVEGIQNVLSGNAQFFSLEYPCHSPDAKRWFIGRATPFQGSGPPCAVVAHEDITDRKMMEEALRESEAFAKSVIESSPDCIKVVDGSGCLTYMSPGGQTLFEIDDLSRFIGAPFLDLWRESAYLNRVENALDKALNGENARMEAYLPTVKNTPKWWSITFTPIKNRQGETENLLVVSRDITESKETERQLQTAKEAAEAANRAKSEFLANMSHEIRTPMNAVLGFTELTLSEIQNPEHRERLSLVYSSARHLLDLINDILDISKIEVGKIHLEQRVFNLRSNFEDMLKVLSLKANKKGLDLIHHIHGDVPDILIGDIARLRQVLLNLVGNAIKFSEDGEILVEVGCDILDRNEIMLKAAVTDSGTGIPRDKIETIFEPFYQVESSTSRKYGGAGLGLAICRQLVEMMGGELRVDTEAGQGSTFSFTARLKTIPECCNDQDVFSHKIRRSKPAHNAAQKNGFKILLAEDNIVNQKLATALLEKRGHRVTTAQNGRLALDAMQRDYFDLILMDIQMPEMDGPSTAMAIRKNEAETGGRIPIIAMTAHTMKGDREAFLEAGMDDYIAKPINMEELEQAIKRVMDKGRRTD